MSYLDRQHPITWTSPTGKSFELNNINSIEYSLKHHGNLTTIVSKNKDDDSLSFLKGNKNNDNDLSKGDIFEDLGISGRIIPLQIIFSGDNHDKESEEFENAFKELGQSRLQLPYNSRPIRVNAQTLTKKQDLVKDIASTIIDVEFIETKQNIPLKTSNNNLKNTLKQNIEEEILELDNNYNNFIERTPAEKLQNIFDKFNKVLTAVSNSINNIANGNIDAILRDIQANLLNGSDITIFQEISKMIDLGFSAISSAPYIKTLLENTINDITGNELKESNNSNINNNNNNNNNNETILYTNIINQDDLTTNDFFISNIFLSACSNILDLVDTMQTRKEATQIAVSIQDLYTSYKRYYDIKYNLLNLNLKDIKASNTNINININYIIQTTLEILIEASFNLKTEFNIILNEDSNLIDIAYKYYKEEFADNPEETINKIIKTNKINDEEFILISKGRNIIIYL